MSPSYSTSSRRRTPAPTPATYKPYLATGALNKTIPPNTPIHADSSLMISAANNWLLGGTASDAYKEWLGPNSANGARASYYRGDTSLLPTVTMYANNNGWIGAGPYTMPMPSWVAAAIGPYCQTGDSVVVIIDSNTGDVWELQHTTPPGYSPRDAGFPSTRWNCTAYRHWTAATKTMLGYNLGTYTTSNQPGTSASKMQMAYGFLVPEDYADCFSGSDPGTVIPHALRMDTFCGSNGSVQPLSVLPARAGDGKQIHGIPCGGRVQLDPTINVATWGSVTAKREPWRSALIKTLRTSQVYGIVQVDSQGAPGAGDIDCASTGSVVQGGTTYANGYQWPWDAAGYGGSYQHGIPYDLMSHFRVLDWNVWTGA